MVNISKLWPYATNQRKRDHNNTIKSISSTLINVPLCNCACVCVCLKEREKEKERDPLPEYKPELKDTTVRFTKKMSM